MSLSQKQFSDFKKVCEQFNQVEEVIEEELVHEICDELIEELIEEGYSEEEAIEIVDEATDLYIDETLCEVSDSYYDSAVRASKKAAQGIDKAARQKRRAGQVRYAKRKAGDALKGAVGAAKGALSKVKSKAAGAAVDVAMAGSMAKKKAGEAKQAAKEAPGKAKAAASDAKKKAKSGIKGFIKRQAQKVVSRMSEENVENEGYQPMTPDRTARVDRAKKKAYDADHSAQYKNDSAEADKQFKRRMAMDSRTKMRKEELEASGLFTEEEINSILESDEQFDEAMSSYDRNRKRAAQRAADRNAARAAGKTGAVPGVGYVSPRRERETYTDEKGTVRHKSGAKNEELELDENRRAARAAGGYKDDSKKQTDPSKAGFTGISNSIADIMKQNKEIEARKKK
tara:strand:- start:2830 stop:4026 length:1197 start_codon:yes stop_codon:yes gene_type:complete